jgi:hypothetical protein
MIFGSHVSIRNGYLGAAKLAVVNGARQMMKASPIKRKLTCLSKNGDN